jgi:Flp pilus assembly protein TadG
MRRLFKQFAKTQTAAVTVEYVIWWPLYFIFFAGILEYGYFNMRVTMLERSVSKAVRDIRLDKDYVQDHAGIVNTICEYGGFGDGCTDRVRVEMRRTTLEGLDTLPKEVACVNKGEEFDADAGLEYGAPDELMLVRVCVKAQSLLQTTYFTAGIERDENGNHSIISQTAFVVEPK